MQSLQTASSKSSFPSVQITPSPSRQAKRRRPRRSTCPQSPLPRQALMSPLPTSRSTQAAPIPSSTRASRAMSIRSPSSRAASATRSPTSRQRSPKKASTPHSATRCTSTPSKRPRKALWSSMKLRLLRSSTSPRPTYPVPLRSEMPTTSRSHLSRSTTTCPSAMLLRARMRRSPTTPSCSSRAISCTSSRASRQSLLQVSSITPISSSTLR